MTTISTIILRKRKAGVSTCMSRVIMCSERLASHAMKFIHMPTIVTHKVNTNSSRVAQYPPFNSLNLLQRQLRLVRNIP